MPVALAAWRAPQGERVFLQLQNLRPEQTMPAGLPEESARLAHPEHSVLEVRVSWEG